MGAQALLLLCMRHSGECGQQEFELSCFDVLAWSMRCSKARCGELSAAASLLQPPEHGFCEEERGAEALLVLAEEALHSCCAA
jgi:hypothetical protein